MSFAPAVPPLPHDFNQQPQRRQDSKPPIPPLPPNFHPEQPLAAPTPERILPTLSADMVRSLDDSLGYNGPPSRSSSLYPASPPYPGGADPYRRMSPAPPPPPPGAGYPGGFARPASAFGYGAGPPQRTGPSPAPYAPQPPRAGHTSAPYPATSTSYAGTNSGLGPGYPSPPAFHQDSTYGLPVAMAGLNISQPPQRPSSAQPHPYQHQQQAPYPHPQSPITHHSLPTSPNPQSRGGGNAPELTAPLPTVDSLTAAQRVLPAHPGPGHVPWIRDVMFLVDRIVAQSGTPPDGPVSLSDPAIRGLAHEAINALRSLLAASPPTNTQLPPHIAEACYLRGALYSTGAFPEQLAKSPREAFKDFETAARAGYQKAWFKLGRDYETVGDIQRAKDCFERGLRGGVESCYYRLGMAHLLGQLSLTASPNDALPLLHRAATLASTDVPQPAYVYGLLLLGEFSHVRIDERMFSSLGLIPAGSVPVLEARKFVERAAFLGFAPAQYKLGHAYEYAVPPFPFDALLSVQYYSLASQQGEPEADMALSKWFLCGADGAFEKDEGLALTFADKAARKGLGSAEFAMGYYAEVGIGGGKNVEVARKWYAKAVEHGNTDAPDRLKALSHPSPQALSRVEHDEITDAKLVRKHTQARMSAAASGRYAQSAQGGQGVVGRIQAHAGPNTAAPAQQGFPPQGPQGGPPSQGTPPSSRPDVAQTAYGRGYSLSDTPATGPAPVPTSATPPSGRAAGRPPGRRHDTPVDPHAGAGSPGVKPQSEPLPPPNYGVMPPPKKHTNGPATFAEMGFQTGKAEDKECVIM